MNKAEYQKKYKEVSLIVKKLEPLLHDQNCIEAIMSKFELSEKQKERLVEIREDIEELTEELVHIFIIKEEKK